MKKSFLKYSFVLSFLSLLFFSGCFDSQGGLDDAIKDIQQKLDGIASQGELDGTIKDIQQRLDAIFTQNKDPKGSDWVKAFEEGKALASSGEDSDLRKATYFFVNALNKNPGQYEIIEAYKSVMDQIASIAGSNGELEDQYNTLSSEETVLKTQIGFVSADKISELQEWVTKLGIQRDDVFKNTNTDDESSDVGQPSEIDTATLENSLFSDDFNEMKEGFELNLSAIQKSLDDKKFENAGYQIQDTEQRLHLLVSMTTSAGAEIDKSEYWSSIDDMRARLEEKAIAVDDGRSEIIWNKLLTEFNLPEPVVTRESEIKPADVKGEGECNKQIIIIQNYLGEIQKLYPQLSKNYQEKANDKIKECSTILGGYTKEQYRRYNRWATDQLMRGTNDAFKGVYKIKFNNQKQIADSLTDTIGRIDTRLLSFEVSRAYQEVLNYFLSKVSDFKRDKDNDRESSEDKNDTTDTTDTAMDTLRLLEQLDKQSKAELADF